MRLASSTSGFASPRYALGVLVLLVLLLAGLGHPARAGMVRAYADASVTILEPGSGVRAQSSFVLPSREAAPATGAFAAQTTSGDTQLTINGRIGDTLSILTPSSFLLVRDGGQETFTATTHTMMTDGFGGQGLMTGASVMRANSMKVDIGCALTQTSAAAPPPGAYRGQFLVLIQYN